MSKPIPIQINSQGFTLQGKFHQAHGPGLFPTLLICPGFPGNEEDVLALGQALAPCGFNVFIFNYRGTFQSEGLYGMSNSVQDIGNVWDYIQEPKIAGRFQVDTSRLILGGYSFGGGICLTFAASRPGVRRVFSVAGTDHGEFVRSYNTNPAFAEMVDQIFAEMKSPNSPVHWATGPEELLENPDPYDLRLSAPKLAGREILLVGGWDDFNNPIDLHMLPLYRELVRNGAKNVTLAALKDDHSFGKTRTSLAGIIFDWLKK